MSFLFCDFLIHTCIVYVTYVVYVCALLGFSNTVYRDVGHIDTFWSRRFLPTPFDFRFHTSYLVSDTPTHIAGHAHTCFCRTCFFRSVFTSECSTIRKTTLSRTMQNTLNTCVYQRLRVFTFRIGNCNSKNIIDLYHICKIIGR